MRLYQFPHSPYCIPIVQAARALALPLEIVNVPNADRGEILRLTGGAYYQVPVLEDSSGVLWHETDAEPYAVPRALDRSATVPGHLFPVALEGHQQILLRYIENDLESVTFRLADPFYISEISDPIERGLIIRHKERKFGRGCVAAWRASRAALFAETTEMLRPFDLTLAHTPFLLGSAPVYADFALSGIIGNFTYHDWNPLPSDLVHLAAWTRRLAEFRF